MSASKSRTSKEHVKKSPRRIFVRFPDVINDKIDTKKFLTASRGVIRMIDKFGKLFAPIKYDMQRNIEKLRARYLTDREVNATLQDMLLLEIAMGDTTVCTKALVWLWRALQLLRTFFGKVVDPNICEGPDLSTALKIAYEETLEHHHDWLTKQLFGLLARTVPTRSRFLQILVNDETGRENSTLVALEIFTKGLQKNVNTLQAFFEEHSLDRGYGFAL